MRVVVFGTGRFYKKYIHRLAMCDIVILLDNNAIKQGTVIDGYMVDSPNNISKYQYDYIIILSKALEEMREQLIKLGVPQNLIIDKEHRSSFPNIRYVEEINAIGRLQSAKGKILLVTHAMNYTGAPLMLFNMAKILINNHYEVCVYTESWGEMTMKYLQAGIHVHKFDDFEFTESEIDKYFSQYDMIVVNTIVLFRLVHKLEYLQRPVIWWLHEEEDAYAEYHVKKEDIPEYFQLHVYGVGNRPMNAFKVFSDSGLIESLIYGIEGEQCLNFNLEKEKITFAIIGNVCKRKAQDIFVEAVRQNCNLWKEKAKFIIVGDITKEQRSEFEKDGLVQVTGVVDHDKMKEIYLGVDVVVCPSLHDPMPVVLAEGMMNRKVCIASDMTGTAELIEPYHNGLVCKAGDVGSLSECIQWVIDHRDKMAEMGEHAFQTYQNHFSMEAFERNVMEIVNQYI
ncbi:MAG: glycosyltransferase [Lachnospiraceae bacterium]|nr:glycosyltransferase [Lachnospiraceae bacterium]